MAAASDLFRAPQTMIAKLGSGASLVSVVSTAESAMVPPDLRTIFGYARLQSAALPG